MTMKKKFIKLSFVFFMIPHFSAKSETNYIVEANPLLFINQGIGLNSEFSAFDKMSMGLSIESFFQTPYNSNGVTANRDIYTAAPFLRYYLFTENMFGPFVGIKLNFTYSQTKIADADTSVQSNIFYVAPVAHLGYRFLSASGFTVSAYAGIGIKSKSNSFDNNTIPSSKTGNQDWKSASDRLNKNVSQIQPDYGFTFGYMF